MGLATYYFPSLALTLYDRPWPVNGASRERSAALLRVFLQRQPSHPTQRTSYIMDTGADQREGYVAVEVDPLHLSSSIHPPSSCPPTCVSCDCSLLLFCM
mmetsp:Transcript_36731/g.59346  ORF Transcript_36731/g.59346 Transcript_36731/m.59346 type:complete len:100 (+) Transcript_36731:173-472(+)